MKSRLSTILHERLKEVSNLLKQNLENPPSPGHNSVLDQIDVMELTCCNDKKQTVQEIIKSLYDKKLINQSKKNLLNRFIFILYDPYYFSSHNVETGLIYFSFMEQPETDPGNPLKKEYSKNSSLSFLEKKPICNYHNHSIKESCASQCKRFFCSWDQDNIKLFASVDNHCKASLKNNQYSHPHTGSNPEGPAPEKHLCPICSKTLSSKSNLLRHEKAHIFEFQCSECRKKYAYPGNLSKHQKKYHPHLFSGKNFTPTPIRIFPIIHSDRVLTVKNRTPLFLQCPRFK